MKHLFQATFLLVIVISNSLYADNAKHLFIPVSYTHLTLPTNREV